MNLIHIIPSNKWGGIQTYALDICRHYKETGWKVTALTRNAVGVDALFSEAGIELAHAPIGGLTDIASVMILARRLSALPDGPTVIHVHRYRDAFTALAARRLAKRNDVKIVSTRHTTRRGRNTFLFRKIYAGIDAHIFVSEMVYDCFRHSLNGDITLPPEKVNILHNSLNIKPLEYEPEPQRGPVIALYQGSLVKGKGLESLIDAIGMLKGIKLRLRISGMGDPDYLDMLRRKAMQRDVMESIDWNHKTAPSTEACIESHFGVSPSSEKEAFNLGCLRFMAAGRPQVATNNGAQKEYLTDGSTAIIVEPDDASALAEAMKRLASDAELRRRIGNEALREYDSRLSWNHFIKRLDNIYKMK